MSARSLPACLTGAALLVAAPLATPALAKEKLVQKVYPVADLVVPIENCGGATLPDLMKKMEQASQAGATAVCQSSPQPCVRSENQPPKQTAEGELMKLLRAAVAPESWSERGGPGMMEYHSIGMALVVRQTPAVQEQVADLLEKLRRLQDVEVAVEVRFVRVPGAFGEWLRDLLGKDQDLSRPLRLNDVQVFQLLEALQGDRRANVMQAPKMTVFNGQASTFGVMDQQFFVTSVTAVQAAGGQTAFIPQNDPIALGVHLTVQPAVSADRRTVYLSVKLNEAELASDRVPLFPVTTFIEPVFEGGAKGQPIPFTQFIQRPEFHKTAIETTLKIADGQTVLLNGGLHRHETRNEYSVPVLSELPIIGDLFVSEDHQCWTEHELLLVTPRIIIQPEEAAHASSACPCPKGEAPKGSPTPAPAGSTVSVLDNLQKLEQAAKEYQKAEHYRRTGKVKSAGRLYEDVRQLCPGSRYARQAGQRLEELQARSGTRPAGDEEAEEPPSNLPHKERASDVEKALAKLLEKYDRACAEGRTADAKKLARKALAVDPTCFGKQGRAVEPLSIPD
jgi:hypothetical protein